VVRVRFANGRPSSIEPFLTAFLTTAASGPAMIGRPMGVAVARDGALLVSDDLNGRIYRVSHRDAGSTTTASPPEQPAPAATGTTGTSAPFGNGELAMALAEARGNAALTVSSPAFASGQPIPEPYSQYGERFSPALAWSGAPQGTRSFVLLMEDPDAKQRKPFIHWVLYDIPAAATRLVESVPPVLRLGDPKGAMQGRNSRGGVGYTGPRPPEGDPPHHYHFQVFALDNTLGLEPGASRDAVIGAMKGHVVGRGELVGTFQRAR
jgi:Raf kinase inhibitor-like YbhB/YbcL family protein